MDLFSATNKTEEVVPPLEYVHARVNADPLTGLIRGTTVHTGHSFEVPLISHITGNLYQGGCVPAVALPDFMVHVISLYTDAAYKLGVTIRSSLQAPLRDATDQDLSRIDAIARWALSCAADGPTLVYCHMGLNRSGLVVARALMLSGLTAVDALDFERQRRSPAALNNPHFEEWLCAAEPTTSPVRGLFS